MSSSESEMPSRRRADAVRSREKLVAAATDLLGRDPDASMETIAARAGVGRTTVFRHFPTRTELVLASWTHLLRQADAALARLRLHDLPPGEALRALVTEIAALAERWPLLFRGERPAIDGPELSEAFAGPEALVATTVQRAVDAGVLRDDLPSGLLSETLLGIVQAALIAGLRGPSAAEATLSLFLVGSGPRVPRTAEDDQARNETRLSDRKGGGAKREECRPSLEV
jgi:AcrR family transcriptional regulator